jgi:hypothetical protein
LWTWFSDKILDVRERKKNNAGNNRPCRTVRLKTKTISNLFCLKNWTKFQIWPLGGGSSLALFSSALPRPRFQTCKKSWRTSLTCLTECELFTCNKPTFPNTREWVINWQNVSPHFWISCRFLLAIIIRKGIIMESLCWCVLDCTWLEKIQGKKIGKIEFWN